ncbi:MAG: hypothetical protein ABUK19_09875 [Desulfobacteria bacterium]|jgi:hypothetical protein
MEKYGAIIDLVLKVVGMAMGVVTVVISILGAATTETLVLLLGIGVFCLGLAALLNIDEDELDKL